MTPGGPEGQGRPQPDPDEIARELTQPPGLEEGVDEAVEEQHRRHELPDADLEFEELARTLARIGLEGVKLNHPPAPLVEHDRSVQRAEEIIAHEEGVLDTELIRSAEHEPLTAVVEATKALGQAIMANLERFEQRLKKRGESGQARLPGIRAIFVSTLEVAQEIAQLSDEAREQRGLLDELRLRQRFLLQQHTLREIAARLTAEYGDLSTRHR